MNSKDCLVWTAIYPGTMVAQSGVLFALVAAGIITRVQHHALTKMACNTIPRLRTEAWELYKTNGEVWPALKHAYGIDD